MGYLWRRLIMVAAVLLPLAGCGLVVDGDQVRLCRLTLPAVNPDATSIVLTAVTDAPRPFKVRLDYKADGLSRYVLCGFGGDGLSQERGQLTAYATDEGIYSDIQLHLLLRYWLQRPEWSVIADPGPGEAQIPRFSTSRDLAYLIQQGINGLPSTAITMLVAAAYALIYGLVGRINLAFGEFATLGGFGAIVGTLAATTFGLNSAIPALLAAGALAIFVSAWHGYVVERMVFAPLAFGRGQSILIVTVALAIVLQEYLRIAQGAQFRWIPPILKTTLPVATGGGFTATVTIIQLVVAGVAATLSLLLVLVMRWTGFGRSWRAVSDDPVMAALLGVSVRHVLRTSFVIASALAGAAGFILAVYYGGASFAGGTMIGLKALVAAVVGGIGSIGGALLGGLAIGLFEMIWSAYLPIEQKDLAVLSLLSIVFILRPGGLFGFADKGPRQV